MPPKKSKKGKKTKEEKNRMTQVDRTFYELTIADLNKKLARLRSYIETLGDKNTEVTEKLRELEYDRTDVAAHLERTLKSREETIVKLEERLKEITKLREEEALVAQEKIGDLETKYKAMYNQMTSELKLLMGKLNSLDEFRTERDALFAKFEDQEAFVLESERKHKDAIYQMEQNAVVEKDALKKDVERRLLQVSEDFTRSSEIRNAGYTRRLIRENIALQKEVDNLVVSEIKLQLQFNNQKDKHREIVNQYAALSQIKTELLRNSVNKIKIIEGLTKNYEKLKTKYVELVRYRKAYESKNADDYCTHVKNKDTATKIRSLTKRIEGLTLDNSHYLMMHEQHESEIIRLQDIIEKIKNTVIDAITAEKRVKVLKTLQQTNDSVNEELMVDLYVAQENAAAMCSLRRIDLLEELMVIVSSHSGNLPRTPSIDSLRSEVSSLYMPGKLGFTQRQKTDIFKVFQHEKLNTEESIFELDDKKLPSEKEERRETYYPIYDVELGSTLYVSSSRTEEVADVEEEPLEDAIASSSSVSGEKQAASKESLKLVTAGKSVVETGLVDVAKSSRSMTLLTDENEEEAEEEEDEYEINLFY